MAITWLSTCSSSATQPTGTMDLVKGAVSVFAAFLYGDATVPTPSDLAGSPFNLVGQFNFGATYVTVWTMTAAADYANDTFTIDQSSYTGLLVNQYSGLTETLDGSAVSVGANGSDITLTCSGFNTTNADDLLYGVAATDSLTATWTANTPLVFLNDNTGNGNTGYVASADLVVSGVQTGFVASMNSGGNGGDSVLVSFALKAISAPSTSRPYAVRSQTFETMMTSHNTTVISARTRRINR